MTRNARLCAALLAVGLLAAAGCKREPPAEDAASVQKRLEDKGTLEVLDEMAAAEYEPPADGKLTTKQIEMYLAVKQRERRIREVAGKELEKKRDGTPGDPSDAGFAETLRALGDVGDLATADLRAAQELGHNPKEYRWVEERVMEALLHDLSRRLEGRLAEEREQYVRMLEAQKQSLTDPAQQAKLDAQIAEVRSRMEGESAEETPASEALLHNQALVAQHRDRIKAVLSPEERFAVGEWEGEKPVEPLPAAPAPQEP